MTRIKTEILLLDSGVWVAAIDKEDRFEPSSRELVDDANRNLGALDLTLYEVANAIAAKRKRAEKAVELCRTVERLCWETMVRADADLIEVTAEIAVEHGLTSYDAAYVAVARRYDWKLISTDLKDLVSNGLAITPDAAV